MENYQQNNSIEIPPQNFMTLSIIVTILGCCTCTFYGLAFILGIIGIYFASQVNSRFYAGDVYGAEQNAKYAKILSLVALAFIVINLTLTAYLFLTNPDFYIEQSEEVRRVLEGYGIESR